jgi:hypothetical protein
MVQAYSTFFGPPKSQPPAIHHVHKRMQIMGLSTMSQFVKEWPTVVMWRFGKKPTEKYTRAMKKNHTDAEIMARAKEKEEDR